MKDAKNELVGQDGELDLPNEQVMNQLLKGIVDMMRKMWRIVLVLQTESVEQ